MSTPSPSTAGRTRERLGDFTTDKRTLIVAAMASVVATVSVGTGWLLLSLIYLITNIAYHGTFSIVSQPLAPQGSLSAFTIVIPVFGCLIIGLMARYGSEKIRGHGIPEAIEAILIGKSRIEPKVAILKPLSSAISIGTGGPFGAEGPIIMTGGALGSLFAQMFMMSTVERKVLLVAGATAGMTAIFGSPFAAVMLAVELLLFEWKPRSFIPVVAAAIVASVERPFLFGSGPLFPYTGVVDNSVIGCLGWISIGIAAGIGSSFLTTLVYFIEDLFDRLPIHWMWWPAIGGFVVGIGGLIEPKALGVGYESVRDLLNGDLSNTQVWLLLVVKGLIWSIALGSGTSGGVLAPLLIMGGTIGAAATPLLPDAPPGFWVLLGMAAMMGGTMRAPLTAALFAMEITGDSHVMLPLLAACAASYTVTVLLMKRSILTEKIARRGLHISREYNVDPFETTRIADVMVHNVETLPDAMTLGEAISFFMAPELRHETYPVVDKQGKVTGIASYADALRWTRGGFDPAAKLVDTVAGREMIFCTPDDLAGVIADRMIANNRGRALVLNDAGSLVGVISRHDFLHARKKMRSDEEDYARGSFWRQRKPRTAK
jgi:H+/Cl- antiporter ClcA